MDKAKPKLPNLGQLVTSLKKRIEQIERDLRSLKDALNTKDNWTSEIKDWIGKVVILRLGSGLEVVGTLLWVDRYNLCLEVEQANPFLGVPRVIFTKGGLEFIGRRG